MESVIYGNQMKNIWLYLIQKRKKEINKKLAKERVKDIFLAYGILANTDKRRFGDLAKDLDNSFTLGVDKYPAMMQQAYDYALNYKKYKPKPKPSNLQHDGLAFATRDNSDRGRGCNQRLQ